MLNLPWCSIFSSFQNSLKTSGHRGYEFLEFWCWNLVPVLADIGFQLLQSMWSYFFHLMMRQMLSIGERSGLQAGQFSTRTLLLRSHAVVIVAVCYFCICPAKIHKAFPEIDILWRVAVALKPLYTF